MPKVKIEFEADNMVELRNAVSAFLYHEDKPEIPQQQQKYATNPTTPVIGDVSAAAGAAVAETEKPKSTRTKKETTAAAKEPEKEISIQEVEAAVKGVADQYGRDLAMQLMEHVKAKTVAEIKPKDYAKVLSLAAKAGEVAKLRDKLDAEQKAKLAAPAGDAAPKADGGYTLAMVGDAIRSFTSAYGSTPDDIKKAANQCAEILGRFGATKAAELKAEDYVAFVAAINAAKAAASSSSTSAIDDLIG